MKTFKEASHYYGDLWAHHYGINSLCGYNAIAPTGSISRLFGGITSGIEPIFSKATKWEYTLHGKRETSISIDSNIQRYLEQGINVDEIEDAYDLASSVEGFERRVSLQANVQDYIDNGISSTIQLARWGSETNNEKTLPLYREILLKYLPRLRGITCYPDGARSGQPLTKISVAEALEYSNREERNSYSNCSSGLCAT
jgi:ribonucleoside-diphosphate reductase alpha chain